MAGTLTSRRRQATPERWQRALERAMMAGVQVRQLQGSGQWIVTSASDPGAAYETDGTTCTCPGAQLGGDPVCLHRAAYWHAQGVLDFDGGPASPAPSQAADRLIESFRGELDYLTGALAYIAAIDHDDPMAA
jgi:hypothetical protein